MRKIRLGLCAMALALLCALPAMAGEIETYMVLYGYQLPEDILSRIAETEPVALDFGDVRVTLTEALYDGRWLFTAAEAIPADPEAVLLMPGSAWDGDLVSGGYNEGERDDDRTFTEAATEDGKRLLVVYAYPVEFTNAPEYFIDHFQRAEDVSTLYAGAPIAGDADIDITWCVQVYEADPETGAYDTAAVREKTAAVTVPLLGPVTSQWYALPNDANLPFARILLDHTGLTTYYNASWACEDVKYSVGFRLLDTSGEEYPDGAPPQSETVTMDALPETLQLQIDSGEIYPLTPSE